MKILYYDFLKFTLLHHSDIMYVNFCSHHYFKIGYRSFVTENGERIYANVYTATIPTSGSTKFLEVRHFPSNGETLITHSRTENLKKYEARLL
jgi:hypothetical protein